MSNSKTKKACLGPRPAALVAKQLLTFQRSCAAMLWLAWLLCACGCMLTCESSVSDTGSKFCTSSAADAKFYRLVTLANAWPPCASSLHHTNSSNSSIRFGTAALTFAWLFHPPEANTVDRSAKRSLTLGHWWGSRDDWRTAAVLTWRFVTSGCLRRNVSKQEPGAKPQPGE